MSGLAKYVIFESKDVPDPSASQQWLLVRPEDGAPFSITKMDILNAIEFIYNVLLWPEWCDRSDMAKVHQHVYEAQSRIKRSQYDPRPFLESCRLPDDVSVQEAYNQIATWLNCHHTFKRGEETDWYPPKYEHGRSSTGHILLSYFRVLMRWTYESGGQRPSNNLKTLIDLFEYRRDKDSYWLDPIYTSIPERILSDIAPISNAEISPERLIEDLRTYLLAQTHFPTPQSELGLASVSLLVVVLYYLHPQKRSALQTAIQSALSLDERTKAANVIQMEFQKLGLCLQLFSTPQFETFHEAMEALFIGE